jgi:hypothetical protein
VNFTTVACSRISSVISSAFAHVASEDLVSVFSPSSSLPLSSSDFAVSLSVL